MIGHIYIYGEIANYQEKGVEDYGIVSLRSVVDSYNAQKDSEEIIVHLHSVGGDVYEGLAIYDFLNSLDKKVTTINEGLVASISTVIYLSGDERQATPNSQLFIHNAWTMTVGDADELQKTSEGLRKYNDVIAGIYENKTNLDKEEALALMKGESEFTADEQINLGFATSKIEKLKAVAKFKNKNNMDLKAIKEKFFGKEEIKNVMLTLEDGTQIESTSEVSEPEVGDKLTLEDGTAVPDGEHTLQSGYKVVTEGGTITEVIMPEEEIEETEESVEAKQVEELTNKLEAVENKNVEISNQLTEVKDSLNILKNLVPIIEKMQNSVSPEINTNKKEEEVNNTIRIKK